MNSGQYGAGQDYRAGRLPEGVKVTPQIRGPTPLPSAQNKTQERLKQLQVWNDAKKGAGMPMGGAGDTGGGGAGGGAGGPKKFDEFNADDAEKHIAGNSSFVQPPVSNKPGIFDDFEDDNSEEEEEKAAASPPQQSPPEQPTEETKARTEQPSAPKPDPPAATPSQPKQEAAASPPPPPEKGGCCVVQ